MQTLVNSFIKEEDGQDLVEYSLLLAFIGLAATAILTTVRTSIQGLWAQVNTKMNTARTAATGD